MIYTFQSSWIVNPFLLQETIDKLNHQPTHSGSYHVSSDVIQFFLGCADQKLGSSKLLPIITGF